MKFTIFCSNGACNLRHNQCKVFSSHQRTCFIFSPLGTACFYLQCVSGDGGNLLFSERPQQRLVYFSNQLPASDYYSLCKIYRNAFRCTVLTFCRVLCFFLLFFHFSCNSASDNYIFLYKANVLPLLSLSMNFATVAVDRCTS